jgi:pentose-5-phosphate-3-epimerase
MIMTVEPGWGGQRFIGEAAPKLAEAAGLFAERGGRGAVHVDGGVNRDTADVVGAWGAEVCVVGSALFQRGRDAEDEVRLVREGVMEGRRTGPTMELESGNGASQARQGHQRRVAATASTEPR